MSRVQLQLKKSVDSSYDIVIERGILKKLASDLRTKRFAENYVVITDTKVSRLFGKSVCDSLKREGLLLGKIVVSVGEKSKSLSRVQECCEQLLSLGANRQTGVIALGGGVVGDLAGFVAASYMRGVPCVQVPTTLLAMVDSSVGGKVGVDLPSGKNMVGAFWQPKKVYIDPEVLRSLPAKDWKSGLGESVKYGAIMDRSLWEFFEKHADFLKEVPKKPMPSQWKLIEEMVERCVKIKAEVVMKDEKEGNLRQVLNYGHTFGHVVELMSDYTILHGEAVAVGMKMAAALAHELRFLSKAELDRQNDLLKKLGLGKTKTKGLIKDFVEHMRKDKKTKGDLRVVLVDRLGRCHQELGRFGIKVDSAVVRKVLKESALIDDIDQAAQPAVQTNSWASSYSSSYSSSSSYSAPSTPAGETDLQKRLREMRERAELRRRMQGGSGSGGLGSGGYLPG
ncbi:MAG: 3-dehydroquinate synthase [bacterium]|nr:3-dehydroquinate synthase [bacterium]